MTESAPEQESAQPVFKAGEYIFRENDPGDVMFIIEKGQVEIVKKIGEEERRLTIFEPGDFFGEMSILEDLPRGASARAVTDCKLLQIDHSTFDQMLRENPEIGIRMMRSLSRRLREAGSGSVEATPAPPAAAVTPSSPAPEPKPAPAPPPPAAAARPAKAPAPSQPAPVAEAKPKPAVPAPTPPPPKPAKPAAPEAKPAPAAPPAAQTKVSAPAAEVKAVAAAKIIEKVSGREFPLAAKPETTVGRPDSVTGILPDIDLSTVDTQRSISRRHAKLMREGTSFFVYEEIGTANGTFVNGERVKTGVKSEVRPGDEIRFGAIVTNFHMA